MPHPVQRPPEPSVAQPVPPGPAGPGVPPVPAGAAPVVRSGAHLRLIRPQRPLAAAAVILACAAGAAAVGATISSFGVADVLAEVRAGGEVPTLLPYDVFTFVYDGLLLVAGLVTCVWLSRARANSEVISTFRHRRSKVWCWLAWMVPFVAWWFPRQVVEDIHRASGAAHTAPTRLNQWWGLWLVATTTSQGADRVAFSDPDLAHVSLLGPLNAVATVMLLLALVLWVRIVTDIVRLQEAATDADRAASVTP